MLRRKAKLFSTLLVAVVTGSLVSGFKDPHNIFCGEDECYAVLGLKRGADKMEIKKAYRTISLDVHPDKNSNPAAKERFTKVAKAYTVFMDEDLNKKYHFFLDNPDAYWLEYGHSWVMKYAKASDVRVVLLGLLALVSFFAYGIQYVHYTTAIKYLRKAAEKNLGPKHGGNAATMQLRRDAEALLAERKAAQAKNGVEPRGSKNRQSRKEKEAELAAVIGELAMQVDIQGSCRKPTWRDQPVVILAMLPWKTSMYVWHKSHLVISRFLKREVERSEREFWVRREVGDTTWEDLDDDARDAAVEGDAWEGGTPMEEWKQFYLYAQGKPGGQSSSKKIRQRKSSTVRTSPAIANGRTMKGVLGDESTVEY